MPHSQTQITIAATDLAAVRDSDIRIVDVRKPEARAASGCAIPDAVWKHPFNALNWAGEFLGCRVVVYCVHGHEVSLAVRGYLADQGIDAVILEGGFEAWAATGLPVDFIGDGNA